MYLFCDDESLFAIERASAFLLGIAVVHAKSYLVDITGCDRCKGGIQINCKGVCVVVFVLLP